MWTTIVTMTTSNYFLDFLLTLFSWIWRHNRPITHWKGNHDHCDPNWEFDLCHDGDIIGQLMQNEQERARHFHLPENQ